MNRLIFLMLTTIFVTFLFAQSVYADSAPYPINHLSQQPSVTYTSTVVMTGEIVGWLVGGLVIYLLTDLNRKRSLAVSGAMMITSYSVGLLMWAML